MAELPLRSGQLIRVLEDWSPSFEGFFLYYHGQRQVPAALRAFIDMIRATCRSMPAGDRPGTPSPESKPVDAKGSGVVALRQERWCDDVAGIAGFP